LRACDQAAGDRCNTDAERERKAMAAIDIDADIGGRDWIVGRGAQ